MDKPRIGIDLLGCDTPGHLLLKAIVDAFGKEEVAELTIFGTEDQFSRVSVPSHFSCHAVTEWISPDDSPLKAIKEKPNASLLLGIERLKTYDLDVFISAGHSGALLAAAKLILPQLEGIDRSALLALMPTQKDPIAVLDVGANLHIKAHQLLQFAKMGIAFQKTRGIEHPTVGLLNIGTEKQRGTLELQKAYQLLQALNENDPIDDPTFIGNIEGRDVFGGQIDVLITDGFTGNVFLKTAEGIAGFVLAQMQRLGPVEKLPGFKSIAEPLRHRLSYAEYPGAILCGTDRGIIMKCHGESSPEAFINTITSAVRLVNHSFLEKLKAEL